MNYRFLRFPGGKAKAVTFSYDDGCRHDIRLARKLTEHGIRCTFNINSGLFGKHGSGSEPERGLHPGHAFLPPGAGALL